MVESRKKNGEAARREKEREQRKKKEKKRTAEVDDGGVIATRPLLVQAPKHRSGDAERGATGSARGRRRRALDGAAGERGAHELRGRSWKKEV